MRIHFIAGLILLSAFAGVGHAQQPLWFVPGGAEGEATSSAEQPSPQAHTQAAATSARPAATWQQPSSSSRPLWFNLDLPPASQAASDQQASAPAEPKLSEQPDQQTTVEQSFWSSVRKSLQSQSSLPAFTVRTAEPDPAQNRANPPPDVASKPSIVRRFAKLLSDPSAAAQQAEQAEQAEQLAPGQTTASESLRQAVAARTSAAEQPRVKPAESAPTDALMLSSGSTGSLSLMEPSLIESIKVPVWPSFDSEERSGKFSDTAGSNSIVKLSSLIAAEKSDVRSASANAANGSSSSDSAADQWTSTLMNTQSMIGPLQSAERLFGRLGLKDDMLNYASVIPSGPRSDASSLWMPVAYTWICPAFYHKPLYFEQPNLERYGVGPARIAQPLLSSAHFFGSIPLVPYKTLTHHPREQVYTLGQGRPGNCVPIQRGIVLGQSTVGEIFMFWEPCSGY